MVMTDPLASMMEGRGDRVFGTLTLSIKTLNTNKKDEIRMGFAEALIKRF